MKEMIMYNEHDIVFTGIDIDQLFSVAYIMLLQ